MCRLAVLQAVSVLAGDPDAPNEDFWKVAKKFFHDHVSLSSDVRTKAELTLLAEEKVLAATTIHCAYLLRIHTAYVVTNAAEKEGTIADAVETVQQHWRSTNLSFDDDELSQVWPNAALRLVLWVNEQLALCQRPPNKWFEEYAEHWKPVGCRS